jgi:multidrug efflux pump
MLSKFFIDRPIFATVLSVIITLTGGIALWFLPVAQYPRITPPSVNVSIAYPGASAQVVAETVAAPIEQQVTGVPGMLYMSSQMGNDGSYSLSVTFDVDVNLNTALVMVQNRVALAMPLLPTPVQNQGITIRKKTPDTLCMINFISAVDITTKDGKVVRGVIKKDDREAITLKDSEGTTSRIAKQDIQSTSKPIYNDIFLSNYALINIKDEILRVDGVSDISIIGQRDYSVRAWLDPQKLASRSLTAGDVAVAIRTQNIQAAAGQIGAPPINRRQSFQLPIDTLGRLALPEQFGNIVVKVGQSQAMMPSLAVQATAADGSSADGMMNGTTVPTNATGGTTPTGGTLAGGANTGGGANSTGGGTIGGGADPSVTLSPTASPKVKKNNTDKPLVRAATPMKGLPPPSVSIVHLKDVTNGVEMGAFNYNMSCTFDGGPAVGLNVYQLPGTNALDVGDRIRAKMKALKKRFPDGLDYTIAYDTTPFIRESISEVFHTLRDAILLVAIVVLLFLQDWRAMILPMIDIPVSLIGTFAVMAAMGYSLNNISLFGLVLAIGIVVDDAIVVLENIERQMAKGYDVRTATIKAMEEISGPILAITLVLCAVFVPCAFISGITGRFFRQFAVTIAASTIISAINALTMTPSRALMIFKSKEGHEHKKEALPWWIFGLLGMVTLSWLPDYLAGPLGLVALTPEEDGDPVPAWQYWGLTGFYFTPGLLAGLAIGWFIIGPVNAVLGAFFRAFNRGFDFMTAVYGWVIGKSLRLSVIVLLGYGGLVVLTYVVFRDAPRGFVPQQDMGRLIVSVQLPDSSGLARTQETMAQVDTIIREVPGVAHTIGLGGISFIESANGSNFASFFVVLQPFAERQDPRRRADGIMAQLRKRFANEVKNARVVVAGSSPIPGISTSGGFKVMVQDRGGLGLATLQDQTDKFVRKVNQQIGEQAGANKKPAADDAQDGEPRRAMLAGVNTQFRSNTPQLYLDIDRTKVASLDVSLDEVNQAMSIYMGSLYVNSFNQFGRHWQVTLQADREFRSRVENIHLIQVRNRKGQMVPLATLVNVSERTGPLFIRRYNLYTAAPITGALLPGVSSGEVITAVDQISDESLPRSMKAEWTELMFMQIKEGNTTGIVFALAVVCVFLALAALYESWTLPLAVILVVPLCMLCSIVGVQYMGTSVNIFVQIGLVVLIGLACKNAILVVEFAKELHLQGGKSVFDATMEASRLRLRPILMTSFAFILGVVPLCVASGAGAEMRKSLGTAVFSGMLGVTAFGIFLTPVFFYVIQGLGETRLFSVAVVQWIVSCLLGALLGAAVAYMLARLGVFPGIPRIWVVMVGTCLGVLAVAAVRGLHGTLSAKNS